MVGDYAYVADGDSGLRIISVADPSYPVEVGYWETAGVACGATVAGSYAYVADEHDGLQVISISDSAYPVEVGCYDTPDAAYNVAVMGDYAYVADFTGGLRTISVADSAHPVEVGYHDTPGHAEDVVVVGDRAYVADGQAGLQIYQFYGAGVEEGDKPQASSLKPRATVVSGVLELPPAISHQPQATSWLLDISGRKVAELHPGPNDASRLAPSVYFVRSAVSDVPSAVRKIIVTR